MREYTEQDAQKAADAYVMYLRKSQQDLEAEKRGEMETLARHEKILNGLVEEQGLNVVQVYKEIVSAETIQDRPLMTQMMKEVYAGKYKGVIVVKPDRLSRGDLENMGYIMNGLKFSETLLVTPGKTYDVAHNKYDEQMLEMQLFNSKQEYRAITARMHEGRLLSVREGNFLGSIPPYGYDKVSPDRWTHTLKPNANAEIVVKIFEWFVHDRMTTAEIARKLYTLGIPTMTGNPEWHRATIKDILQNIIYTGKNRWYRRKSSRELDENGKIEKKKRRRKNDNQIIVPGKHPAIISDELFEKAQELFCGTPPKKAGATLVNPLAGLLKCAECGRVLCYREFKHHKDPIPRFCHTETFAHKVKSSPAADVLELLAQTLQAHIDDFSFKVTSAGRAEEIEKHREDVAALTKELERAKVKRRRLFDDYEEGIYTPEEFKERKAVWADRIERMEEELEHLNKIKPHEVDYKEKVEKFTEVLSSLKNPEASAKATNNLLKEIIERIDYSCEDLGRGKGGIITLDVILKD